MEYTQGKYKPKNPQKYRGNPTNIVYRSGLELKIMKYFDEHKDIVEWENEERVVPYRCKTDGRMHRYFPDFLIKIRKEGKIETIMIEAKPHSQVFPPKKKKNQKTYLNEVMTYAKNISKWEAATEYCLDRGWKFRVLAGHYERNKGWRFDLLTEEQFLGNT